MRPPVFLKRPDEFNTPEDTRLQRQEGGGASRDHPFRVLQGVKAAEGDEALIFELVARRLAFFHAVCDYCYMQTSITVEVEGEDLRSLAAGYWRGLEGS